MICSGNTLKFLELTIYKIKLSFFYILLYSTKVVGEEGKLKFINLFLIYMGITGLFYLLKSARCSTA